MDIWDKVDVAFLNKRGIIAPLDYSGAIISMDLREAAIYTISRFGLNEDPLDIENEWKSMVAHAYKNTVRLKPYAKTYIDALRVRGAKMAIATSLPAGLYEPAMISNGITSYFSSICSTDETAYGKTRPDVYLLAAKKLGVQPADCIVYEDLLDGIKSAKSAGMIVYAIYDKTFDSDWPLIKKAADRSFRNFQSIPLP